MAWVQTNQTKAIVYTCDLLRAPYRDKCPTSVNNVYLGSWADAGLLPSI